MYVLRESAGRRGLYMYSQLDSHRLIFVIVEAYSPCAITPQLEYLSLFLSVFIDFIFVPLGIVIITIEHEDVCRCPNCNDTSLFRHIAYPNTLFVNADRFIIQ